ncbi:hypothetical protein L3Y34_013498 [Caenorhabditis briggsae]|uniref:Uncharacterized protein n=1 Tax=Caenorhabditis briggsae TaxID=6238 RepID=A0AAE8ZYK5_CAEBR|nr:hypothetical protein L3Y34_013498 [Caenorhabditis briggsae]
MSLNNNAAAGNLFDEDVFQNAIATIRRVSNIALHPRYSVEVCIQVALKCQVLRATIDGILRANTQDYWRAAEPGYIADLQDLLDYVRININ